MRCPNCGSFNTSVVNSQRFKEWLYELNAIWRRRRCNECDHRWSTYEIEADRLKELMQKTDGEEEVE